LFAKLVARVQARVERLHSCCRHYPKRLRWPRYSDRIAQDLRSRWSTLNLAWPEGFDSKSKAELAAAVDAVETWSYFGKDLNQIRSEYHAHFGTARQKIEHVRERLADALRE